MNKVGEESTGRGGGGAERDHEEGERRHRGHQRSGKEAQSDETISGVVEQVHLKISNILAWCQLL